MLQFRALSYFLVFFALFPTFATAEEQPSINIHIVKPEMTLPSVASTNGVADELIKINQKANSVPSSLPSLKARLTFAPSANLLPVLEEVEAISNSSRTKEKHSESILNDLDTGLQKYIAKTYIFETAMFLNPWAVLYGSFSKNDLQHLGLVLGNYDSSPMYLSLGKLNIPFGTGESMGFDGSPLGKLGKDKNAWSMALGWMPAMSNPANLVKIIGFLVPTSSDSINGGFNVNYTYKMPEWTASMGAAYTSHLSLLDSQESLNAYAKMDFDKRMSLKGEVVWGLEKGLKQLFGNNQSYRQDNDSIFGNLTVFCVEGDVHFSLLNHKSSIFYGWGAGRTKGNAELNRVFGGIKLTLSKSTNIALEYVQGLDNVLINHSEPLNSFKLHVMYSLAE